MKSLFMLQRHLLTIHTRQCRNMQLPHMGINPATLLSPAPFTSPNLYISKQGREVMGASPQSKMVQDVIAHLLKMLIWDTNGGFPVKRREKLSMNL